jgi:hypothetical protein
MEPTLLDLVLPQSVVGVAVMRLLAVVKTVVVEVELLVLARTTTDDTVVFLLKALGLVKWVGRLEMLTLLIRTKAPVAVAALEVSAVLVVH